MERGRRPPYVPATVSREPTRMLTAERVWHSPCKGHQGRAMVPYRIYWFGPDSHIVAGENIECASDEEVQAKAREAMRNGAAKGAGE
jgi:hypothetical protein